MDDAVRLQSFAQRRIALVCSILLTGCAANPYSNVKSAAPDEGHGVYKVVSLPAAVTKLREYREDYRAKRSAEFDRQQKLSAGIFGLGALALTLGAYGAHRDAVTGVAIAGATTYQAGTWNTAPGRNAIYAAGIQALDCGAAIMGPTVVASSRYATVQTARTKLGNKQEAMLAAQAKLQAITITGKLSERKRKAYQSLIDSASAELTRARKGAVKASEWSGLIEGSGQSLSDYVSTVNHDVEKALSETLADPNRILDSVNGLESYLKLFSGIAATGGKFSAVNAAASGAPTAQGATAQEPGEREVNGLLAAQAELTNAIDGLNTSLDGASLNNPKNMLAGCKVDMAKAAPAIQVDPSDIELVAGVQYEQGVTVKHNAGIYRAVLKSVSANGISVNQSTGSTFSVVVGPKSAAGTYLIDVMDNNSSATVTVRLVAQQAGGADNGPPGSKQGSACIKGRSKVEICLLQQFLKVDMDGDAGEKTCTALVAKTNKAVLDGATMKAVKASFGLADTATDAEMGSKLETTCPASVQPMAVTVAPAAPSAPQVPAVPKPGISPSTSQPPAVAAVTKPGICQPVQFPENCRIKGSKCRAECTLNLEGLTVLGRAVGLKETPVQFDDALRAKIKQKQKELGINPQTGEFTDELRKSLGLK